VRRHSFDQYEFDDPSSEEALELAVSSSRQVWPLAAFLAVCGASERVGRPLPAGWPRWAEVAAAVRKRAGVDLPAAEACEVVLLSDDWDDVELAVVAGSVLVWYHWWTTA
jgi:hypothetical protein